MLNNYFKTAWRNITGNRSFSVISALGITLGLSAFLLIFTVVFDELSYDTFWKNSRSLYKANQTITINDVETKMPFTPVALGTEIESRFPEVQAFSSVSQVSLYIKPEISSGQSFFIEALSVDTSFISMFDINSVNGKSIPYVPGVRNIAVAMSLKDKYFRNENPVGKTIYDISSMSGDTTEYLITAVINDIPPNTHLRADAIILSANSPQYLVKRKGSIAQTVYYQLKEGTNASLFAEKVNNWYTSHMDEKPGVITFSFQPIQDVYLDADFDTSLKVKGKKINLVVFSAVGILLLAIGCINFINLNTAQSLRRLKETGIRKILGAGRKKIVKQFLIESFLFFSISAIAAIVLYFMMLPATERFLEHRLTYTLQSKLHFLIFTILGICILSVVTGIYPAWVMSGLNPSDALRNRLSLRSLFNTDRLRKGLVVVQFVVAIVVLVSFIVVNSQIQFINNKELGYNKENLLYIKPSGRLKAMPVLKDELNKIPGVLSVGVSIWNPIDDFFGGTTIKNPKNPTQEISLRVGLSDLDFARTMELKFLDGRYPSKQYGADRSNAGPEEKNNEHKQLHNTSEKHLENVIITKSTAQLLGVTAINTPIPGTDMNPIGIIEDFYARSLHLTLDPTVIMLLDNLDNGGIYIRIHPQKQKQVLAGLQSAWDKLFPGRPLEAIWVDEAVKQLYNSEYKQQALISVFGTIMLILSGLGVLGLIFHSTAQRTKEIGIRKVMGASVWQVAILLSQHFIQLVIIAILIASPIAWWFMNKWLQGFAYRTEMKWWMFALAGSIAILVALLAVSFRAIKAAMANPVKALRSE
ncbi:MAG: FtsX-like permease family protein [Chitinophagaceae bacterium]|nr:FtsX-like permease family protein [Chitinophagaceae bacterium]